MDVSLFPKYTLQLCVSKLVHLRFSNMFHSYFRMHAPVIHFLPSFKVPRTCFHGGGS